MISETLRHRMVAVRESGRFEPALLDRLQEWIETAPDEALFRVNPIAFAAEQKLAERDAIDFFVHATHAGIFDFAWGLVCPACSGFLGAHGLRETARERDCGICEVRAGETLDTGIEVSFTVSPAVRRLRFHGGWGPLAEGGGRAQVVEDMLRLYFSHALQDESLVAFFRSSLVACEVFSRGVQKSFRFELDPKRRGTWRILAPGIHAVCTIAVDPEGPSTASLQLVDGRAIPGELRLRPGAVQIELLHRSDEQELLVGAFCLDTESLEGHGDEPAEEPESSAMAQPAFLSGRRLLSTQTFRELFRTETLPPDGSLEIRALAMLFTDLKSSTQMYERVGDLKALDLVRQHFTLLREVVMRHEGAIVKTIGDAVMATFDDPVKATAAAIEMHRVLEKVPELQLKVGVHVGPCVAVDSNEQLDYFGQTVNIAARVQALADGREVVLTDTLVSSPGVAELLKKSSLKLKPEQAQLKGIDQPVAVHRTTVG